VQEAIALSMGQTPPGQENGVTGTGQQFGPARGEYHDTQRWAMTVSKATTREVVEDPPPAERQRRPGEPAFLRPSTRLGSENLAALLTIYHSIPLAREALLLPNYQPLSYGYDPQWWTGHHIEVPKIVSLDENAAQYNRDDVLIETQRLMAFLDDTSRAYASIDALADLPNYHEKEAESELSRFLEAWNDGAMIRSRDDPLTQVFSSHGIRIDPNTSTMDKYFTSLEPMVDPESDQNFIDILDSIIWYDQLTDRALNDIWIDEIGEIVTLRLSDPERKQGKLGVEIPAVWYPDRYMEHFRDASRDIRMRRRKIKERLWRLDRLRDNILSCTATSGQGKLDIKNVLSDAADRAPLIIKNQPQQGVVADPLSNGTPSSAEVNDCVKALQGLVASVELKLTELETIRDELRADLRAITTELTGPGAKPSLSPSHRYTLRGMSTKQHITYVMRSIADIPQEQQVEGSVSRQWQWWRISVSTEEAKDKDSIVYGPHPQPVSSAEQPLLNGASGPFSPWPPAKNQNNDLSSRRNGNVLAYTVLKVSEEDVLKAAREEDDSITLVYASDKAVDFQGSTLTGPLQLFLRADNKVFDNELRGKQAQGSNGVAIGEEMAQLHFPSLDGMHDVPLIDDSDETMHGERESSAPATMASPRREADGQPSPKRAKAEDDPPPYRENIRSVPEMQERNGGIGILGTVQPGNIAQHAEKVMDRVRDDAAYDRKGGMRLERSSSE
jgi:hypothetical protein